MSGSARRSSARAGNEGAAETLAEQLRPRIVCKPEQVPRRGEVNSVSLVNDSRSSPPLHGFAPDPDCGDDLDPRATIPHLPVKSGFIDWEAFVLRSFIAFLGCLLVACSPQPQTRELAFPAPSADKISDTDADAFMVQISGCTGQPVQGIDSHTAHIYCVCARRRLLETFSKTEFYDLLMALGRFNNSDGQTDLPPYGMTKLVRIRDYCKKEVGLTQ